MIKKTLPLILHPHVTKITSIIIGYLLWLFIAQFQWITIQKTIPICFYQDQARNITAPDTVSIIITGPRKEIYKFHPSDYGLHIDASTYPLGKNIILLNAQNLFLPDTIKLIQLIPTHISIEIDNTDRNYE